jgi:NADH dehydrogenase
MPTNTDQPRIVIVGAGFGGLQAASALRNAPARVTVIDRSNHHVFQPLLYQVATAGLSPADISAPIRHVLRGQQNTEVLLAEVASVDTAQRQVHVQSPTTGEAWTEPYDYLILATGAGSSYFGHDEWERYAPGLKTIPDATAIRRNILLAFENAETELERDPTRSAAADLTFVIVGGGPTGVELAGAIAELARHDLARDFRHIDSTSARILLVEAGPRILPTYPEPLSARTKRQLERMGVEVKTDTLVERVDEGGVVCNGELMRAQMVIWAAGVKASPVGRCLGVEMDRAGRVFVLPDLSVPDRPEIFVLGDAAHVEQDGKLLPGIAPVAMQEGRYVGRLLTARLRGKTAEGAFRYWDKGSLATVGRAYAVADLGWLRLSGLIGWLVWTVVHIFYLIGFRNRLVVMLQWAWIYLTFQRGARLITLEHPARADTGAKAQSEIPAAGSGARS